MDQEPASDEVVVLREVVAVPGDGERTVELVHRPSCGWGRWLVRDLHAYEGGGGFGYNPSHRDRGDAERSFEQRLGAAKRNMGAA